MSRFVMALAMVWLMTGCCALCTTGAKEECVANEDRMTMAVLDSSHATREENSDLDWYEAADLTIEGKGWTDTDTVWERLPSRWNDRVPEAVRGLGKCTAGIAVRFKTNSSEIGAIWSGGGAMNHMAATGNSGLDLYILKDDGWEFCGVGKPKTERTLAVLKRGLGDSAKEFMLYLPLYHGVSELKIGVESGSFLAQGFERPADEKPIVFYGTSITQGGCASRAGMCHPAIIGRWLDREVINLGFSGAGKMEPEMGEMIRELDPKILVLDCLPNMTPEMVKERVVPFVESYREKRADTPILLVEAPYKNHQDNIELRKAYETLLEKGVKNLHYMKGDNLLKGRENGTVDGVHPTDLGFFRMAEAFEPVLRDLM